MGKKDKLYAPVVLAVMESVKTERGEPQHLCVMAKNMLTKKEVKMGAFSGGMKEVAAVLGLFALQMMKLYQEKIFMNTHQMRQR